MKLHTLKTMTQSFVQGSMILLTLQTTEALAKNANPDIKELHTIETPVTNDFIKENTISLVDSLLPKERKTLYNVFETLPINDTTRSIDVTKLPETLILNLPKESLITLQSIKGNRVTVTTNIPINIEHNVWEHESNKHLKNSFTPIAELHTEEKEMVIKGKKIEKVLSNKSGNSYYSPSDPLHYLISIPESIKVIMYDNQTYSVGEAFKTSKNGVSLNALADIGSYKDKTVKENKKETMTYTLIGSHEKENTIISKTKALRETSSKNIINENPILIEGEKIYLYQDILDAIKNDNTLPVPAKVEMIKHFGAEYKKVQKGKRTEKISQNTEIGSLDEEVITISTLNSNIFNLDGISGSIFKRNYDTLVKDFQTGVLTQQEVQGIIKTLSKKNKEFK